MKIKMKDGWPVIGTVVGSFLHCWIVMWDTGAVEYVARTAVDIVD